MLEQDMEDATPAQTQQEILDTNHGRGVVMDMAHRLPMINGQVRRNIAMIPSNSAPHLAIENTIHVPFYQALHDIFKDY